MSYGGRETNSKQEGRPLLKVKDSFKKIIIVKEPIIHWHNEDGVLIISLKQFLFDENSLML